MAAKKKEIVTGMFYSTDRKGIKCEGCARKCVIPPEKSGYCLVRKNVKGKLVVLNYGKLVNSSVEPVEKIPMFHFTPGASTFSIASVGNNLAYQPNEILNIFKDKQHQEVKGEDWTPEKVVDKAEKNNCKSISFTATEPAIYFEFAYRTAKAAARENIKTVMVTNAYITEDVIKKISKFLTAVNVNIYASADEQFYMNYCDVKKMDPIYDVLKQIKKHRLHLEITNWVIPQIGDNIEQCRKLAQWISSELDCDVPLHIMRFYPDHKFPELPPTPIATLEKCIEESRKTGLRHVYIGNVPEHVDKNTYCYNCRALLIERQGFKIKSMDIVQSRCPNCGIKINMVP